MATTTFLITGSRSKIDSIELDASISETHTGSVAVTDHPVEKGFNVSDHARPEAETLQIEGFISNTPFAPAHPGTYTDKIGRQFAWEAKSEGDATRANTAYKSLLGLKDAGTLITVVTSLRTYENMLVTALSVPRDAQTGNGLRFSASLKKVRVVTSQAVEAAAGEDKTKTKTELHKKAVETFYEPPKSVGLQLFDAGQTFVKGLGF